MENAQMTDTRQRGHLEMRWVPATDAQGHQHLEARWITVGEHAVTHRAA